MIIFEEEFGRIVCQHACAGEPLERRKAHTFEKERGVYKASAQTGERKGRVEVGRKQ
jgi:hypothetical protein